MVRITSGGFGREVRTVFGAGPVSGLTDAELLGRFVDRPDDGASFAALVARHGPMVRGVCRDLLGDEHAADDAFQATFLVLVRKARSVRVGDSLGRWLYGVARRVALHARAGAARHRRLEGDPLDPAAPAAGPGPREQTERADLRALLHEELGRLPESYRAPIVLCHLEGMSHEEAASRLSWPVGTLRSRLSRGRDRLRGRLVRRGAAPGAVLAALAGSSWTSAARAAVPAPLAAATVAAAASHSGGPLVAGGAGAASAAVLALTRGALFTMTLSHAKLAAGLLAVGLVVTGSAVLARQDGGRPAAAPAAPASPPAPQVAGPLKDRVAGLESREKTLRDLADRLARMREEATRQAGSGHPDAARLALEEAEAALHDALSPAPPVVPAVPAPKADDRRASPDATEAFNADDLPVGSAPRVLGAQYRLAQANLARVKLLRERGVISAAEVEQAEGEVATALARVESQLDRYRDELEVLRVRAKQHQAELAKAKAQRELALAVVARNERLITRIPGSVSQEEVRKTSAEVMVAEGLTRSAEADAELIDVRVRQLERRLKLLESLTTK